MPEISEFFMVQVSGATFSFVRRRNKRKGIALILGLTAIAIVGCAGPRPQPKSKTTDTSNSHINERTKFSSKEYGVAGSPRMSTEKRPRKGGGRFQIGKPYKIAGRWYTPKEDAGLNQVGLASWYGPNFHGRLTANGEIYDQFGISAAHPTLPLPSYAKVTNLENGRQIVVRVNDRGPYAHGRVIDLSAQAAKLLGYDRKGLAKVRVEYAGKAQLDGLDENILLASYRDPAGSGFDGTNDAGTGTMIAMAEQPIIAGPTAAIESQFASATSLAGGIPIPTERPTLFEGVPLAKNGSSSDLINNVEQVIYRPAPTNPIIGSTPRPMAYWEEQIKLDTIAYHYFDVPSAYQGEFASKPVEIGIGIVSDRAGQQLLEQLLSEAGVISVDTITHQITLKTEERQANQVLSYLRSIGLYSAEIY